MNSRLEATTRRGLSIPETALKIGCGRSKVYNLIQTGQLRAVKVGARTIILDEDSDRYIDSLTAVVPTKAKAA